MSENSETHKKNVDKLAAKAEWSLSKRIRSLQVKDSKKAKLLSGIKADVMSKIKTGGDDPATLEKENYLTDLKLDKNELIAVYQALELNSKELLLANGINDVEAFFKLIGFNELALNSINANMPGGPPTGVSSLMPQKRRKIKRKNATQKRRAKPARKAVAKPVRKAVVKPVHKAVAKPVHKAVAKPVRKAVAKPVRKAVAKPVRKAVAKPVRKAVAKPVRKAVAKVTQKHPAKASMPKPAPTLAIPNSTEEITEELISKIFNEISPISLQEMSKTEFNTLKDKLGAYFRILKQAVHSGKLDKKEVLREVIPPEKYALGIFYSHKWGLGHKRKTNPMKLDLQSKAKKFRNPREAAKVGEKYAAKYIQLAEATVEIKPYALRHLTILTAYASIFAEDIDWGKRANMFKGAKAPSNLAGTHPGAIDVFFRPVNIDSKKLEEGPAISTMTPGIVIAAANDWQIKENTGVADKNKQEYDGGGFSPISGNGVVVFNPDTQRLHYYVHMHTVDVKPGDIVSAGDVLGKGGNTGTTACCKGRGAHVHYEVHKVDPKTGVNKSVRAAILVREMKAAKARKRKRGYKINKF